MKMKKIILTLCFACSLNVQAAVINITPDSSLTDAVRKAREIRRLGQANEVSIHLETGTYYLYEPLCLRPEDSGLTIEGLGASTTAHGAVADPPAAVISGGIRITGWRRQGRLLVADVPDHNGRPIDFRQLWVNGQKAVRARDIPVATVPGGSPAEVADPFEQMHRIRAYDKRQRRLWVPLRAVEKILKAPNAELELH